MAGVYPRYRASAGSKSDRRLVGRRRKMGALPIHRRRKMKMTEQGKNPFKISTLEVR